MLLGGPNQHKKPQADRGIEQLRKESRDAYYAPNKNIMEEVTDIKTRSMTDKEKNIQMEAELLKRDADTPILKDLINSIDSTLQDLYVNVDLISRSVDSLGIVELESDPEPYPKEPHNEYNTLQDKLYDINYRIHKLTMYTSDIKYKLSKLI